VLATSRFSPPATSTRTAWCPVSTFTPSARSDAATSSETSGSSRTMMRGAISTCVTALPSRAKLCASSLPMGPPPSTTRRAGNSVRPQTVSLVRKPASLSPGIGGTKGPAPAAMTMALVVSVCCRPSASFTSTVHGLVMRAWPCSTSTPRPV
jgi:hypothetical protein